jgi:hypothetical protein
MRGTTAAPHQPALAASVPLFMRHGQQAAQCKIPVDGTIRQRQLGHHQLTTRRGYWPLHGGNGTYICVMLKIDSKNPTCVCLRNRPTRCGCCSDCTHVSWWHFTRPVLANCVATANYSIHLRCSPGGRIEACVADHRHMGRKMSTTVDVPGTRCHLSIVDAVYVTYR